MKQNVISSSFRNAVILGAFAAILSPVASAATVFDFSNLEYSHNTFSGFTPTDGILCSGGDECSSNINSVLGGDLTFLKNGITVKASASYNGSAYGVGAAVVQDHENSYNGGEGLKLAGTDVLGAGLGVYHEKNNTSDDNITSKESLKLHFDKAVTLSFIGLRSDGHVTTDWAKGATFQYSFDNTHWVSALLPKNVGQFAVNKTGTDFYFRYGGKKADQFYLSSMTVTTVPEPEVISLLLAGMGFMGFISRRRRVTKLAV